MKIQTELRTIPLDLLVNNTGQVEGVRANPRLIKDEDYKRLKKSLRESDLTDIIPLKVLPIDDGKFMTIGGNMRLHALQELGVKETRCVVIPRDTPREVLNKAIILDNSTHGEWDFDMLANEWTGEPLEEWGVNIPTGWQDEEDNDEYERKKREFEERMKAGEISEEDEEYQEFLRKFELKKTTDDCYTPELVYEAVADWVAAEYGVNKSQFVRPFYPGGDYQNEKYPDNCIVVDNPPFSIFFEILQFYNDKGIKFFLFGPHLTLFTSGSSSCSSAVVVGVVITYENGANVNTSFVTNINGKEPRFKTAPTLYKAIKDANDANLRQMRKELPKYSYDHHLVTTPFLGALSRLGIDFECPRAESFPISQFDAQKESGKVIYGKGYLVSDRVFAEREKAEREKAEREKAEREKAEREKAERYERWELSDRERAIIAELNKAIKL